MLFSSSPRKTKSSDRRRRSKRDYARDSSTSPRPSRQKTRSGGSRSSRKSSSRDGDFDDDYVEEPYEGSPDLPIRPGRKVSMLVPEMERRRSSNPSSNDSRSSLPYPSFSKAHSREAVNSKEDVSQPQKGSLYTPDTTDVGQGRSKSPLSRNVAGNAPPSPPLTANVSNLRKAASGSSMKQRAEKSDSGDQSGSKDKGNASPASMHHRFSASRTSLRDAEEGRSNVQSPKHMKTPESSPERLQPTSTPRHRKSKSLLNDVRGPPRAHSSQRGGQSHTGSDATEVGAERKASQKFDSLPERRATASPALKLHTGSTGNISTPLSTRERPSRDMFAKDDTPASQANNYAESNADTLQVPPAPPPPPPMMPANAHRVDYLLQNGGLSHPVARTFSSASQPPTPNPYFQYTSPLATPLKPKVLEIQRVFQPFNDLLDNFSTVMDKRGSIAVATGYRSVARRLLDRLEAVFARNISSEICTCVMCNQAAEGKSVSEQETGVSWGEILEFVSGRRELPPWPPFSLPAGGAGLGLSDIDQPMQKLDIDVPDEFRDHYIKQSKKTKLAVQKWLASQPEAHVSPPQEVDDETLTFAMLTYLDTEQRRTMAALMRGLRSIPDSRAPTPLHSGPRSDFMSRIGLSIQRLYRLPRPPRDPESAMFLLQNPHLHSVLATLSAISSQEWDILVSGRFDGFLWSGADDQSTSQATSSIPSPPRASNWSGRSSSYSRAGTPGNTSSSVPPPRSNGPPPAGATTPQTPNPSVPSTPNLHSLQNTNAQGPVAVDEETEMAVLAEVEREIFSGMEALEDAFEALHTKAETIRTALRERSAGLAMAAQSRKGSEQVEVRTDTPASNFGWPGLSATPVGMKGWNPNFANGVDSEEGWAMDGASELAPDDSASNVGMKKHRRKRRARRETRTPAAVEEED